MDFRKQTRFRININWLAGKYNRKDVECKTVLIFKFDPL